MNITNETGIKIPRPTVYLLSMTFNAATIHTDIAALLPRLRRFARAITYNREDGDDLVQVAVERALSRSEQWEAGTRLDSWIFRIMKNAWIDEVRSRIRRDQVFAPEEAGEHVGDDFAEAHQQRMAIQKAMSLLSEDHRIVIALVLVDGMAYKEAADVLDIPIGTLTSRLARAREALQGLLSDQARTVA
jgi:RNA polymerase sigma factor (sigma-70 family)